ncbi:MAG TPA: phosphoribosylglycinamide formyltransferase [Longimicrobiales bacterium]|nr:phosphoribosylglycinamide formyltransferase [Longimicrobiales bacterium]
MKLRTAVFASGSGTNFQALLDRQTAEGRWQIVLLVSDRESAGALARAERAGVPTAVVPVAGRDPADVATDTLALLERHRVDLILLAGYLRLVPPEVVRRYEGRILNIHPALLPAFGGKGMYGERVHAAVLAAGEQRSGATVHFVDEEYDRGRILAQRSVPVLSGDTPRTLAARVLQVEHGLYPEAVDHLCAAIAEGREPEPLLDGVPVSGARPAPRA